MLLVHVQLRHLWDIARILMIVRSLSNAMGSINIYINVETVLFGTSIFLLVDMDLKCTIVSDNFIYILSMNPSIHIQTNKKSVNYENSFTMLLYCSWLYCHSFLSRNDFFFNVFNGLFIYELPLDIQLSKEKD